MNIIIKDRKIEAETSGEILGAWPKRHREKNNAIRGLGEEQHRKFSDLHLQENNGSLNRKSYIVIFLHNYKRDT